MATYVVALNGNDTTGNGTSVAPWRTVAKGISFLNPNDNLYIRAGTWTEPIDTLAKAGLSGAPITISGYPGDARPRFRLTGSTRTIADRGSSMKWLIFQELIWDGTDSFQGNPGSGGIAGPRFAGCQNLIIRDMEFTTVRAMFLITGNSSNISVQRCSLHDFTCVQQGCVSGDRFMGFYLHDGSNLLVEDCDVYGHVGGAMQIQPGPITGCIIRRNKFHDNQIINANSGVGGCLVYRDASGGPITGVQIYNNLSYRNGITINSGTNTNFSPGINVHASLPEYSPNGVKIWNNVCYGNNGYGIHAGNAINTECRNNICFANFFTQLSISNGVQSNNLTTSPSFVNPSAGDFHLLAGSPAIDAGFNLFASGVVTDHDGVARPSSGPFEIGAYEFGGAAPDITPPQIPQNVRVL